MHKIGEYIKAHPYRVALIVFVIGLLWLWLRGGSSSNAGAASYGYTGLSAAEVNAATQLQLAGIQSQTQTNQINASLSATESQNNAQVSIAQLAAQTSQVNTQTTTTGNVDIATLQAQTNQLISTLNAQVAETQSNNAVAETQIQANAYTAIANAPYASADYIAGLQYNNTLTSLQDQLSAANTNLATANANVATETHYASWIQGELDAASAFAAAHPTSPFQPELSGVISTYTAANPAPPQAA